MRTILLFALILTVALAGCKKCYRCNQPDARVTVCRSSTDTIWFVFYKGIKTDEQRIQQFIALGYVCTDTIVDNHYAGGIADDNCLGKEEYDQYTWLGYDCYRSPVTE